MIKEDTVLGGGDKKSWLFPSTCNSCELDKAYDLTVIDIKKDLDSELLLDE